MRERVEKMDKKGKGINVQRSMIQFNDCENLKRKEKKEWNGLEHNVLKSFFLTSQTGNGKVENKLVQKRKRKKNCTFKLKPNFYTPKV